MIKISTKIVKIIKTFKNDFDEDSTNNWKLRGKQN